jgi:hypothetical protein
VPSGLRATETESLKDIFDNANAVPRIFVSIETWQAARDMVPVMNVLHDVDEQLRTMKNPQQQGLKLARHCFGNRPANQHSQIS